MSGLFWYDGFNYVFVGFSGCALVFVLVVLAVCEFGCSWFVV